MKGLFMRLFVLMIGLSVLSYAGIYNTNYSPLETSKKSTTDAGSELFNGDFDKILRFSPIYFEDKELSAKAKEQLDEIADSVKKYSSDTEKMRLSIIGYTEALTDDKNEQAVASKSYANGIIKWFSSELDHNNSTLNATSYAQNVLDGLENRGVDKALSIVENRAGEDKAFSDETSDGRQLSNRVVVTLYLFTPEDSDYDSDGDGVLDKNDKCPKTPQGVKVNVDGCPLDSDKDGVYDYKDECPGTKEGIVVDPVGCPLDTDKDGVYDYEDACPGTPESFKVDKKGCPLSKKLMINFAINNATIEENSFGKIEEFAKFLKDNTQYGAEIVGHTDSIGSKQTNMKLSQRRAVSVKMALIKEGVSASRLKSRGRGELEPIANNRSKEGRRENRRIEVKLYY